MLKTDYIEAFTEAIKKADLENENVVRNLDNALVMASAKYSDDEGNYCVNIEGLTNAGVWEPTDPTFNFGINKYRLKSEPQYKPFDMESFEPYRDCWFNAPMSDRIFKVLHYNHDGVAVVFWSDEVAQISWKNFMDNYHLDGKPAGVEV